MKAPRWQTEWCPKHLIEVLQAQQRHAPSGAAEWLIGKLIGHLVLVHRPTGADGKHGTLHTETCGCEDK